jgi:hypothetical protein
LFSRRAKPQRTARVRLDFPLAAAALKDFFEHPVVRSTVIRASISMDASSAQIVFFNSLLGV